MTEYTPAGRPQAFTVPATTDAANLITILQAFADDAMSAKGDTVTGNYTITGTVNMSAPQKGGVALVNSTEAITLTNKTLTAPVLLAHRETMNVSATAATGTIAFNAITSAVWYYTTNASGNFTLNIRGDAGTTLNTVMATGQALSVMFLNTNGSTPYYMSGFQIDGGAVTPKWMYNAAPSAGNASSIDAYDFTIVKTATSTFTVFASMVRFA